MPPVTARELDRLTGLGEGHASMLEKRRRSDRIEARTIDRIARVFGCSMEWLFRGEGKAPTAKDVARPVLRARSELARSAGNLRPTGTC
jgi:transcriptional regulator with XRE-family HTH domain